jgi:hypothetical protein
MAAMGGLLLATMASCAGDVEPTGPQEFSPERPGLAPPLKVEFIGDAKLHAGFSDAPQAAAFFTDCGAWTGGKGGLIYPPTRPALYCTTRPTITPTGSLVGAIDVHILATKYANGEGRIKEYTVQASPPGGAVNGITNYRSEPIPVDAAPEAGGFTVHAHADNVAIWEVVDKVKTRIIGYISLWDVVFTPKP